MSGGEQSRVIRKVGEPLVDMEQYSRDGAVRKRSGAKTERRRKEPERGDSGADGYGAD